MRKLPPIPGPIGADHLQRIKQDAARGIGASSGDTLHLLAEVERLNADNLSLRGSCKKLGAEHAGMVRAIKKTEAQQNDAARYRWLRGRDLDTIQQGGVFAGQTPRNVVLNGDDLDMAVDVEIAVMVKAAFLPWKVNP
ncbi:hypothetical protein WG29040_23205 [Pseudomonas sp. PAMC 29040]|uniref:hypothetical protein n=1 Tax=Pseudomonas sp. PAMC 29040 TaxID=2498450 RepID=UPI000FBA297D|nr:hypothetical protein [Pseudomonas sp. PAMC 29040]RUT30850.1 hypothetical protein WG29040_23205 [Pseudomonas sp. PAMC 29040]